MYAFLCWWNKFSSCLFFRMKFLIKEKKESERYVYICTVRTVCMFTFIDKRTVVIFILIHFYFFFFSGRWKVIHLTRWIPFLLPRGRKDEHCCQAADHFYNLYIINCDNFWNAKEGDISLLVHTFKIRTKMPNHSIVVKSMKLKKSQSQKSHKNKTDARYMHHVWIDENEKL